MPFLLQNLSDRPRLALRDIRELIEKVDLSNERTGVLNLLKFEEIDFIKSNYKNSQNKAQPEYLLTKDGFTLLIIGYTTENAMDFKLAYINKYNEMEKYIKNLNSCRVGYPDLT